jgi:hypothetical protein
MGYIDEINAFQQWLLTATNVSATDIALWYALMHYNNTTGWKREFNVAIKTLEVSTKCTKPTVIKARNKLKQLGLIDFISREGNQSAIYRMIPFRNQFELNNFTQMDTQSYTQMDAQPYTQVDTIHRLDKTRLLSTNTNVLVEGESPPKAEKKKATRKVFVKPTPLEIQTYVDEQNLQIDAERFFDYYEGNGWKVGKNPMKDWKATARNWSRRNEENGGEYNQRTRVTTKNEPKTDEYADLYL